MYAEKCATFGANSKFLCFKTVLDEVVVKVIVVTLEPCLIICKIGNFWKNVRELFYKLQLCHM